jgi:hypothetical protein
MKHFTMFAFLFMSCVLALSDQDVYKQQRIL